jgi:carbon storage regulator
MQAVAPLQAPTQKSWEMARCCLVHTRRRFNMLVLTRRAGEQIDIGSHVKVVVVSISRGKVKLAIAAPVDIRVNRAEVTAKLQAEEVPNPDMEPVHD